MAENKANREAIDLSESLKNSRTGAKSGGRYRTIPHYTDAPKMSRWMPKYLGGFVKDGKQKRYILGGFVVVILIVALFLVFNFSGQSFRETEYNPNTEYGGKNLPDNFR